MRRFALVERSVRRPGKSSTVGNVESRPDFLAKLKRRCKEYYGREWVKRGWNNRPNRLGRDGGGKGRVSVSTPRESPPAEVAPMTM